MPVQHPSWNDTVMRFNIHHVISTFFDDHALVSATFALYPPSLTPPNPPYPKLDAIPSNFFNASNFWPISIEINKRRFIPHRRRRVGCFYCSCRDFKRFGCGFCMIFFNIPQYLWGIADARAEMALKLLRNCSGRGSSAYLFHSHKTEF